MVTHVLSGISATTYLNDRQSSDGIFKKTVVTMMGYDSTVEDVSIELVTDVSVAGSRSLVSAAAKTELVYSIATPSRIFNDTKTATARFIQSLNESITTGVFDAVLRDAGTNDFQAVATEYVIFSTASPTSLPTSTTQPSSTPTSQPVLTDVINTNTLSEPITGKVVSEKVNYYLGTTHLVCTNYCIPRLLTNTPTGYFVAYFVACFIILAAADYSKIGQGVVKQLHDSAYSSGAFTPSLSHGEDAHSGATDAPSLQRSGAKMLFQELQRKDCEISKLISDETKLETLLEGHESAGSKAQVNIHRMKGVGYSAGFYAYIDQRRTYLGCQPVLYPDGQTMCGTRWQSQKSVLEDLIIFLCNNHSVFNCVYSCEGAPVDRTGNRLIYITQTCLAFFLSAISGSVLNYIGMSASANIVFDILVTTPATIAMAKVMKTLYVCPLDVSVEYQVANPRVITMMRCLGKSAIIPIVAAIVGLLVLSAVFSRGHDTVYIIVSFFVQVQLYGFVLELVVSRLMFVSTVYMRVTMDLCVQSILLLEVGNRYAEMIYHKGLLVEGKDYHYRCKHMCYLLRIEFIYTFDDAVKKGYVREADRLHTDTEMQTTSALHRRDDCMSSSASASDTYNRASSAVYEAEEISTTSSFVYSGSRRDSANDNNTVNNEEDRVSLSTVYNTASKVAMPVFDYSAMAKSADNLSKMRDVASAMPSEEELYQEYQNEMMGGHEGGPRTGDSADVYDCEDNAMTFEEWKVERKKFKSGTPPLSVYI